MGHCARVTAGQVAMSMRYDGPVLEVFCMYINYCPPRIRAFYHQIMHRGMYPGMIETLHLRAVMIMMSETDHRAL